MPASLRRRGLFTLPILLAIVGTVSVMPTTAGVPNKPDVVPTSLSVGSGTVTTGVTAPLQVTISNRGKAPAYSVMVTISIAAGGITSQVSKTSLGTLQPGTTGTIATMLSAPTKPGTYDVTATATTWRDGDRTNNSNKKSLQVADPSTATSTSPTAPTTTTTPSPTTTTSPTSTTPSSDPTPTTPTSPTGSSAPTVSSAPCDYYASGSGGGDGRTSSTPFTVQNFWSVASPGKTLCLLNGTYTGATGMIKPPDGLSGTSTSPITIRALNDGGALFDGGFVRVPVDFRNNSFWVLEGFNAKNGGGAGTVIRLADGGYGYGPGSGSNDNVLRRIVAWDADARFNIAVADHAGASRNLWEDVAVFGTGRNTWHVYIGQDNICRRCWARLEATLANHPAGPIHTFQPSYSPYGKPNQGRTILENVIGTWYALSMPQTYYPWNGWDNCWSAGIQGTCDNQQMTNYTMASYRTGALGEEADAGDTKNNRVLGSIFYLRSGDAISAGADATVVFGMPRGIGHTLRDVLTVISPGYSGAGNIVAFSLGTAAGADCSGGKCTGTADRITAIGPRSPLNHIGTAGATNCTSSSGWTLTNCYAGASVPSGSQNLFTGTAAANLCYRYVNGVRQDGTGGTTVQPLWPWPMDQRIKDAMMLAGVTQQPCGDATRPCTGGRFSRVGSINSGGITGELEALLGVPIPASCRSL